MHDMSLSAVKLTNSGRLISYLAQVSDIPAEDLAPIYEYLERQDPDPESAEDGLAG